MLLLYWLARGLAAMSTTGYLYSRHTRAFVGREDGVLNTRAQPERFTIRTSGGSVQLLASNTGAGPGSKGACSSFRIEMNRAGEIRIRQGHRCEAVVDGYLEGRKCGGSRNQRFVWIPASLLEGTSKQGETEHLPGRRHRPHYGHAPRGRHSKPAIQKRDHARRKRRRHSAEHSYTDSCEDQSAPAARPKRPRRGGRRQDTDSCEDQPRLAARPKKHRHGGRHRYTDSCEDQSAPAARPKRPRRGGRHRYTDSCEDQPMIPAKHKRQQREPSSESNESPDPTMDIHATIFCLQHPDLKECRYFNKVKARETIKNRLGVARLEGSEDTESTSDPNAAETRISIQPRVRGYFANGIDYDDGCACDDECIRNPKNGQCYYRMDDSGNLAPMLKPCNCGDGNKLCELPNVIDKFFCELAFLNDYTYFSKVLDNGI